MTTQQGSLDLLQHPIAQELLQSPKAVTQLAYTWSDGTPRVVPIWFSWSGNQIVVVSPSEAPKVKALQERPQVALTINNGVFPDNVLLVRGTADITIMESVPAEYADAARRSMGAEAGDGWVAQASQLPIKFARIAITPEWVGVLDFQTRLPNALERAFEQASGGQ